MVDRYLSLKFDVNPFDGFQENDVYGRTDGLTDDGRPRHDSSSAVQKHKAELKIKLTPNVNCIDVHIHRVILKHI